MFGFVPSAMDIVTGPYGLKTGECDFSAGVRRYSVFRYDRMGRIVYSLQETVGGRLRRTTGYNYDGSVSSQTAQLIRPVGRSIQRTLKYGYDRAGRQVSMTVDQGGVKAVTDTEYDSRGLVSAEHYGNGVSREYSYDSHGWLTQVTTRVPRFHLYDSQPPGLSGKFYICVDSARFGDLIPVDTLLQPDAPGFEIAMDDYVERLLYAEGRVPRYSGVPSGRITSLGGRYDYRYDGYDRLVRADYTPGSDADPDEDFSAVYEYDSMSAPVRIIRQGVVSHDGDTEWFGVLDDLTLFYSGGRLSNVRRRGDGEDFFGRTGYGFVGDTGSYGYVYDEAGNLVYDVSRLIDGVTYNRLGQPLTISCALGSSVVNEYDGEGHRVRIRRIRPSFGGPAVNLSDYVSLRSYVDEFVLSGDSLALEYAYFPGGYYDGEGQVHYLHTDFQGSVTMVTDRSGYIEQHNGYYPYGEPWREPSGQPRLFGGKERLRDGGLNTYDYGTRLLYSPTALWDTPVPLADDYPDVAIHGYCAANPVKFIDPSGMKIEIPGGLAQYAVDEIMTAMQILTDDKLVYKTQSDGNIKQKLPV